MFFLRLFLFLFVSHTAFAGQGSSKESTPQKSPQERILTLAERIGSQEDVGFNIARLQHKEALKTHCKRPNPHRLQQQKAVTCSVDGQPRDNTMRLESMFDGLSLHNRPEKILSAIDGRTKVTATQEFPWSTQCVLNMSFKGCKATGSGTLIGPNLVLTAAHNLYDRDAKETVSRVTVIPGFNAGNCPFGKSPTVEALFYPDAYVTTGEEDYALLVLQDKVSEATGHMGLWSAPLDVLKNATLSVTGYPGDKRADNGGQLGLYTMSGKPSYIDKGMLAYTIDTYPGQSGSAVYCKEGEDFFVVGVHVLGGNTVNSATLLTKERLAVIEGWMQDYTKKKLLSTEKAPSFLEKLNLYGTVTPETLEGLCVLMETGCFNNLASLTLWNKGLTDLTPLSGLTGLTELSLNGNKITNITALSGLKGLKELHLGGNQIEGITPLSGLTGLKELWLGSNQIEDITPLSGLKGLTRLKLDNNQITNIMALSGLTGLKQLYLANNQIEGITALSSLTGLTELSLGCNEITDITALSGLAGLTKLELWGNKIEGITPLSGLKGLTTLHLNNNQITNITPLSGLKGLTILWLGGNQITNITALSGLTGLTELDLSVTAVTDFSPLMPLKKLTQLKVDGLTQEQLSAAVKARPDLFE